jgi:hypothetical protein
MPKQIGIFKSAGSIDDVTFFKRNGKYYFRKKTGISPERLANDPDLWKLRQTGQELKCANKAVKQLKTGLSEKYKQVVDKSSHQRLVSVFRSLIPKTKNVNTERPFNPAKGISKLKGYSIAESRKFDSYYIGKYSSSVNADRNEVTLTIPSFNAANLIEAPELVTHFRIFHGVAVLSSFTQKDGSGTEYEPTDVAGGAAAYTDGPIFPLDTPNTGDLTLTTPLGGAPVPAGSSVVISFIGIDFFYYEENIEYIMRKKSGMMIESVY